MYDDMREKRVTQPTGVDWAVARKQEPVMDYIATDGMCNWGFRAVVVNWRYVDLYVAEGGRLPVGERGEEVWDLNSEDVVTISLGVNVLDSSVGKDIWVLSHLDYPLVHCQETYDVFSYGADGSANPTYQPFVRTSSLVDIHSRAKKIVFVVMTDNFNNLEVGGHTFRIPKVTRFQVLEAGGLVVQNFDTGVRAMLNRVLNSTQCLREAFEDYTSGYFTHGLNWLEVDNLAALLRVRWHPK